MKETEVSATAIGAALMRAAHLIVDGEPKIFRDDYAMRFGGFASEADFRAYLDKSTRETSARMGEDQAQHLFRSVRSSVTSRARYTEDALADAMTRGISRFVVLGAGLDSFAWRHPELADRLEIYEVDHPASQEWKQQRLRELNLEMPRNLHFIPIDFEKQTLLEGLRAGGLPANKPAFFSWLGVTLYLTRDTVLNTLKQIASLGAGTEICFTFRVIPQEKDQKIASEIASSAASVSEPFLSSFEPQELKARLQELGYSKITHFSHEDANAAYFARRTDGLKALSSSNIMLARI